MGDIDTLRSFHPITFLLTILGAINWGLIGLFEFNFIGFIFVRLPTIERITYIIIGIAAIIELFNHAKNCKFCSGKTTIYPINTKPKPPTK